MTEFQRYERYLKTLEDALLMMCRQVTLSIENTVLAIKTNDKILAEKVYKEDDIIDEMEERLEKDCLKTLLLRHPIGGDFREVSAILKMLTDLERIGDQCADICQILLGLEDVSSMAKPLITMGDIASSMVRDSVNAYLMKNSEFAITVAKRDDSIDEMFEECKKLIITAIKADSQFADLSLMILMIAKYFERIGDHSVNICEWTIFLKTGKKK